MSLRILSLGVLFGALQTVACHESPPPKPPPPALSPAPAALRSLAIHVHRLASPPESPQDEWDYHHMSGLTQGLREAVQLQLARAGYTVIVDRHSPSDVVAVVQASWPMDRAGVATITLTSGDATVDQLSVEIPIAEDRLYDRYLEEHAAVALVEAMNRSRPIAEAARSASGRGRPSRPANGGLRIAAPPTAAPSGQGTATEVAPETRDEPGRY